MNLDDMFGDDMDGVENKIDCERAIGAKCMNSRVLDNTEVEE